MGSTLSTAMVLSRARSLFREIRRTYRFEHLLEQNTLRVSPYDGVNSVRHSLHDTVGLLSLAAATLRYALAALHPSEQVNTPRFDASNRDPHSTHTHRMVLKHTAMVAGICCSSSASTRSTLNGSTCTLDFARIPHSLEQNRAASLELGRLLKGISQCSQSRSGASLRRHLSEQNFLKVGPVKGASHTGHERELSFAEFQFSVFVSNMALDFHVDLMKVAGNRSSPATNQRKRSRIAPIKWATRSRRTRLRLGLCLLFVRAMHGTACMC